MDKIAVFVVVYMVVFIGAVIGAIRYLPDEVGWACFWIAVAQAAFAGAFYWVADKAGELLD